mmetsp:Transcript_17765/g.49582  ORF Transcript_17765/g.49582 Transcript_17765/m.49582 type:complete len:215 (-) Transcript_17765:1440-2084(-)
MKKSASRSVQGFRLSSSAISAMYHAKVAFCSFMSEPTDVGEGSNEAGLVCSARVSTLAISSPCSMRSAGLRSLKPILNPRLLAAPRQSPYTSVGGSMPSGKGDRGPAAIASKFSTSFITDSAPASLSLRCSMAARPLRFVTSPFTVKSGFGRQLRFCWRCESIHHASNSSSSTLPPPSTSTCLKIERLSSGPNPASESTCANSSSSRLPVPSSS